MKKRAMTVTLVSALIGAMTGCLVSSAEEKTYDEHIDFTYTGYYSVYQAANGYDIESDEYIQWVKDKFNVSIDQWACDLANSKETIRLWVNGGTMPDSMFWPSISIAELTEYADQGLIQALPEGWEEKWPNLARMIEKSGYGEMVKVDGLTYAIPHAIFGNFNSMEKPVSHNSIYWRKDWAEQVGMADMGADFTINFTELEEYLTKVKEAGLCDNAVLSSAIGTMAVGYRFLCKRQCYYFDRVPGRLCCSDSKFRYFRKLSEFD